MADEGFTAFFQGGYPRVVGQLRLLADDLAAAEDAAQEAFVRAAGRWRQLSRYDQPEAWVRMTAFRLAIDQQRRARRQRRLLARLGSRRAPDSELDPQNRAAVPGAASAWPSCSPPTRPGRSPGRPANPRRSGMPGRELPDLEERLRQLPAARRSGRRPRRPPGPRPPAAAPRRRRHGRRGRLRPGDPAADALPRAPEAQWLEGNHGLAVWTGRELLVGSVEEAGEAGGVAAYDPAADRWRMLPPSPQLTGGGRRLEARTAMWAGSRLLVWTYLRATPRARSDETDASDGLDTRPAGIDLWAYDPAAGRWSVLPAPPEAVREVSANAGMSWTGREVVIVGAREESVAGRRRFVTRAGRYDPDRPTGRRSTRRPALEVPTSPGPAPSAGPERPWSSRATPSTTRTPAAGCACRPNPAAGPRRP